MTELDVKRLQQELEKLKKENASLKKQKKFGLVWEEREREANIDDGEYYPYLMPKGGVIQDLKMETMTKISS